jgi:hypothetical protein
VRNGTEEGTRYKDTRYKPACRQAGKLQAPNSKPSFEGYAKKGIETVREFGIWSLEFVCILFLVSCTFNVILKI